MKPTIPLISLCAAMAVLVGLHARPVANMFVRTIVDWPQWARTPQHTGATPAVGQSLAAQLSSVVFDPFTSKEMAETGGGLQCITWFR
jgi:hypothetical protein